MLEWVEQLLLLGLCVLCQVPSLIGDVDSKASFLKKIQNFYRKSQDVMKVI